jgi:trigger factor
MTIPQYLAVTGQDQTEFVANLRESAVEAVRADLALRAVVAQEGIAATDEEVDAEIEQLAARLEEKPAKVRKDLERRGVLEAVRSDIARGKALAFLLEHAEVVDTDGEPVDLSLPKPTDEPGAEPDADPEPDATADEGVAAEAGEVDESEEPKS